MPQTPAPTVALNVPVIQLVQTTCSFPALYFPAAHSVHTPPAGPAQPALHIQPDSVFSPIEFEFAGHVEHADAPVNEYLPIVHSLHVSGPLEFFAVPATHLVHVLCLVPFR